MEALECMHKTSAEVPDTSTLPDDAVITHLASRSYVRFTHDLEETVTFLQQANWRVELKLTQAAGEMEKINDAYSPQRFRKCLDEGQRDKDV